MNEDENMIDDLSHRVDELKDEVLRLEKVCERLGKTVSNINPVVSPTSLWPICLFGSVAMLTIPLMVYIDKK